MKWLSFVNALVGIALILTPTALGFSHETIAATAVQVAGLIVLVLGALRWITGFSRYAGSGGDHLTAAH